MTTSLKPHFSRAVPDGDTFDRNVCNHCGFVSYDNPRIIVGSVVRHDGQVLLCRRSIEPRRGFWTVPAGFLELGETPQEGARREAREEANANLELDGLLAIYTVRKLSQVQLIFRARLPDGCFSPGEETLEAQLFGWDRIPWDDLAFPTVHWMLNHQMAFDNGNLAVPFANPPETD